jgi:uncharacterized protein (TIGR02611 family)
MGAAAGERAMFEGVRTSWRRLRAAPAGERFIRQYRAHQAGHRRAWTRPLTLGFGALVVAVGLVALPAPGPGTLVVALGAALLARESETVARLLDRIELWATPRARRIRAAWRGLPGFGKGAIIAGVAAVAVLAVVGVYFFWILRG